MLWQMLLALFFLPDCQPVTITEEMERAKFRPVQPGGKPWYLGLLRRTGILDDELGYDRYHTSSGNVSTTSLDSVKNIDRYDKNHTRPGNDSTPSLDSSKENIDGYDKSRSRPGNGSAPSMNSDKENIGHDEFGIDSPPSLDSGKEKFDEYNTGHPGFGIDSPPSSDTGKEHFDENDTGHTESGMDSTQSLDSNQLNLGDCTTVRFPKGSIFKECLEDKYPAKYITACDGTMNPIRLTDYVIECTLDVFRDLGNSGSSLYLIRNILTEACNRLGCGELIKRTYEVCNGGDQNQPLKDCSRMHVRESEACGKPFEVKVPRGLELEKCLKASVFKCKYSYQRNVQLLEELSQSITCLYTSVADTYPEEETRHLSCKVVGLAWLIMRLNGRADLEKKFADFRNSSCPFRY